MNIIKKDLIPFIKEIKNDYKIIGTKVTDGNDIKTLEKNEKLCIGLCERK